MMTEYIFLLCEPGMLMTHQFELFGEELARCNWYALPIEMQRIYALFLSDSQHPIEMTGYGGITCDRDTAKRVNQLNVYIVQTGFVDRYLSI